MSVARCQREVDSYEFAEWYADYCIEPWGEFRADLRMALAMMQICAMKGGKRLKISDFMLNFDKGRKQQTAEEAKSVLLTALGMAGL